MRDPTLARRAGFVAWALAAAALLASPGAFAADAFTMEWRELARGVWVGVRPVSYQRPVVTNTTIVIGERGVLVFDAAGFAIQGERLLEKVAELTELPITHVVISHWHGDHNMGLHPVLAKYPRVEVISHEFTAKYIASPNMDQGGARDPEAEAEYRARVETNLATGKRADGTPITPTIRAFYVDLLKDFDFVSEQIGRRQVTHPTRMMTDHLEIDLGGRTVELHHVAPGNTKGDVFMWLPEERILATGDIVVRPTPYGFFSYPRSWAGVLRELKAIGARTIIPGHGELLDGTSYLDLLIETMELVADQVDAQARAGKSLEETRAAIDWSPVEQRFTGGEAMLAFLFNLWFKTPIVEAQYNLSTGKDNESLEPPPASN